MNPLLLLLFVLYWERSRLSLRLAVTDRNDIFVYTDMQAAVIDIQWRLLYVLDVMFEASRQE